MTEQNLGMIIGPNILHKEVREEGKEEREGGRNGEGGRKRGRNGEGGRKGGGMERGREGKSE